ncbi:hypothetical protein J5N97_017129 [Dioscorea zingiberensis]|uniref:Uncharacterized protein n=1 Tax=Dioscorea zingiberensis TaxID=325984 RepID=A0A9D5CLG9_9LILI|nr:hypothetical protein J5N97_017129 [Dioscorea zingiberensis]
MVFSREYLKALADRIEIMGIPHYSGMFLWGLSTLWMVGKARFCAKVELMKSLGWSKVDFLTAFRTNLIFLTVFEAKLREKMDFFVKIASCKPSKRAKKPTLRMYSLEKRLLPWYHVVQILKLKRLYNGKSRVWSVMYRFEKRFMEDFILCHRKKALI